jgi:hypothetical protein
VASQRIVGGRNRPGCGAEDVPELFEALDLKDSVMMEIPGSFSQPMRVTDGRFSTSRQSLGWVVEHRPR